MDCSLAQGLQPPCNEKRAKWWTHVLVIFISLLGGAFGILGAFVSEVQAGGLVLGIFVGAPIVEELCKPLGVYLALVKWPEALRSRLYTALLCAGAGLVFGILEALVYLYIYVPDHTHRFVLYRLTVPLAIHAVASYTVGLGLDRRIVDVVNRGDPLPRRTRNFYLGGVAIHGIFNATVTVLAVTGLVDFQ